MKRKKKIAIIGTAGVPARYGGFETLAEHLVRRLSKKIDLSVYGSSKLYTKSERKRYYKGARCYYLPLSANGLSSIFYDVLSIIHALFYADYLLILGVSGGIIMPFVRLFSSKKMIVHIDGLEWRRPKWNRWVKKYLKFSEYLAVKYSHIDITDNAALKKYTAIYYKTLSYLVAYGADHVSHPTCTPKDYQTYPFLFKDYAFSVCRIEPENNIHLILKAYAQTKQRLVFVGNWNHSPYGRALKEQYQSTLYPNLHLLDPIYAQKELNVLRANAKVYVHGHSAGGTNPSLVEAMYLKLPVFAFNVSYNKETTQHKALYFKNVSDLSVLSTHTSENTLKKMRLELYKIAEERYTWKHIAQSYLQIFKSLEKGYAKQNIQSKTLEYLPKSHVQKHLAHLMYNQKFYENR